MRLSEAAQGLAKGVTEMRYYLAYGSNLNLDQMQYRCPKATPIGTAVIKGYELLFKGSKTGSYLTIEKNENEYVPVGVWEVNEAEERRLDIYEGYPTFYYKKDIEVWLRDWDGNRRKINAFVYIMHEDRPLGEPSLYYVRTCAEGYRSFGFKLGHLRKALEKSVKGDKR